MGSQILSELKKLVVIESLEVPAQEALPMPMHRQLGGFLLGGDKLAYPKPQGIPT